MNQITVPCVDYDASVAFYRALGLRQIVDSPPRYARFECPDGGATLSIHHHQGALEAPSAITIYFEVDDVDERVAALEDGGLVFTRSPVDQRWLWREASLQDPAGNAICIYHAGENRRFPPWRLGGEGDSKDRDTA